MSVDVYCPNCTVKTGHPNRAGLYGEVNGEKMLIGCLLCGWSGMEVDRHDYNLLSKAELKKQWQ